MQQQEQELHIGPPKLGGWLEGSRRAIGGSLCAALVRFGSVRRAGFKVCCDACSGLGWMVNIWEGYARLSPLKRFCFARGGGGGRNNESPWTDLARTVTL